MIFLGIIKLFELNLIESETEWGLELFCRINKRWEVIALKQLTSHIEQAYNNTNVEFT